MMRFKWNALRRGDVVGVHRGVGPELTPGTVEAVDVRSGSYGVGILLRAGEPDATVLWPSRIVVHLGVERADEPCWRCESPGAV
jgi:hypothetical protein